MIEKNVLTLNGSPRPKGNTDALCAALTEGAESAGHKINRLDIRTMEIEPCRGCYQCVAGKGTPCVQRDEMQAVYDALATTDVLVFASPLYWWHFTAQMKTVIDRIFAVAASSGMHMEPKEVALLIAAEDAREKNFSHIVPYYKTCLTENLGWKDRGMVLAGGVNMPGDVEKTDFLWQARDLGARL